MAYVTSDRVRVELDSKRSRPHRRHSETLLLQFRTVHLHHPGGQQCCSGNLRYGAAQLLEGTLRQWLPGEALVLLAQTLISTGVILLTGEFFPKTIFGINPNNSLKVFALPLYILYIVLYPVSIFTAWLSKMLMKLAGVKDTKRPLHLISIGELGDYIEETIDDPKTRNRLWRTK